MRQNPSDPDIQTIYQRIKQLDLDLQPNFQRGEVWSLTKKQRLIDSILRDWHIPPIHVIETEDGHQEVLDGQQRLAAIRDFIENKFEIDGSIPPDDATIANLSGLTFSALAQDVKRRFERYTVRVFRITDYRPGEPGELFFRLNQPTSLTAAETRNAFFGVPRNQVRDLVKFAISEGVTGERIAMSTARMAYDDVVARFCATLEFDSLLAKVTATDVTARYRRGDGFANTVLERAQKALSALGHAAKGFSAPVRLNKATMHSWLLFLASSRWVGLPESRDLGQFISRFEASRQAARGSLSTEESGSKAGLGLEERIRFRALQIFNDRASSRVADVSSVIARDAIIWLFWIFDVNAGDLGRPETVKLELAPVLSALKSADDEAYATAASEVLELSNWGRPL